jgi:hypothetical protein
MAAYVCGDACAEDSQQALRWCPAWLDNYLTTEGNITSHLPRKTFWVSACPLQAKQHIWPRPVCTHVYLNVREIYQNFWHCFLQ